MLIGNILSGHLADAVGRKKPIFLALLMFIVFNLLSYLSVNWIMYAVVRAFTGMAAGIYLTIRYNYLSEFSLSRWRTWLVGFPSFVIEACILAFVLWLVKDWRRMHLVITIVGVPFLATWWYLFIYYSALEYDTYCKFGNFRENFAAKSVKRHICDFQNSQLVHGLPISVDERVIFTFREDFIFTKLRICEVSRKQTLAKMSGFTASKPHLLAHKFTVI